MRNAFFYFLFLIPLLSYSFDKCEESLSPRKKRSFEQAQAYVQKENIQSGLEYRRLYKEEKLPKDMPFAPNEVYVGKGWKGWKHFLGTQSKSFEWAQAYVQKENIKSRPEYRKLLKEGKLPEGMPGRPEETYKNKGWRGWGHFLGIDLVANQNKQFRSLNEAQECAQQRGIKSESEYFKRHKNGELPKDMPSHPEETYKNKGWKNWGHFLGTHRVSTRGKSFRIFNLAQKYVQKKNIKSGPEYRNLHTNGKLPEDMPFNPNDIYAGKGWKGWKHFLGTLKMMAIKQAQNHALNKAGIETVEELTKWLKSEDRPPNFPEKPQHFYEEWISSKNFLKIRESDKMNYFESKKYMQSLGFKNKEKHHMAGIR